QYPLICPSLVNDFIQYIIMTSNCQFNINNDQLFSFGIKTGGRPQHHSTKKDGDRSLHQQCLFDYQLLKVAGVFGDDVGAVFTQHDGIRMPESADARHVDSRLYAEYHAGREHEVVVKPERRLLMLADSDAVSRAV